MEISEYQNYAIGAAIIGLGVILFIQHRIKNGTAVLEVAVGDEPERVFRAWRDDKWHKKISRGALLILAFAIVAVIVGTTVAVVGYMQ
jgi:hypothetical protein